MSEMDKKTQAFINCRPIHLSSRASALPMLPASHHQQWGGKRRTGAKERVACS